MEGQTMWSLLVKLAKNPFVQRIAVAVLTAVVAELTGTPKKKKRS
jgi:hypothetical protein